MQKYATFARKQSDKSSLKINIIKKLDGYHCHYIGKYMQKIVFLI